MNAWLLRGWMLAVAALSLRAARGLRRAGAPAAVVLPAALALPYVVHVAAVLPNFALSRRAARRAGSFGEAQPPAVRALVRMVLVEAACATRAFAWQQPVRPHVRLPRPAGRGPRRVPVLLVHGLLCNRAMWSAFARHLAARGHPVDAVTLEPAFGPIDGYAMQIDAAVRTLQARTGCTRVAIVAHSMGGLALRAWLRACGDEALALGITLGTPHAGTFAAAHAGPAPLANVRQMRLGSDWLQRLSDCRTGRDRLVAIRSRHDNIVAPESSQVLEGAGNVALDGIGHLAMAFDPQVMALVAGLLEQAPLDETSRSARRS